MSDVDAAPDLDGTFGSRRPARSRRGADPGQSTPAPGGASSPLTPSDTSPTPTEFHLLGLEELRRYRQALTAEENRVSYWRRIIQGRLDVVRAGESSAGIDVAHLRPALSQAGNSTGRGALIEVQPAPDFPPLPDLQSLWDRCPPPGAHAEGARLAEDLVLAERQLSDYRAVVHRRIHAATTELITRYSADPSQCLSALPRSGDRPAAGQD